MDLPSGTEVYALRDLARLQDVVNVKKIGRILEAGTERVETQPALPGTVITGRFARDPDHVAVTRTPEAIVTAAFTAAREDER